MNPEDVMLNAISRCGKTSAPCSLSYAESEEQNSRKTEWWCPEAGWWSGEWRIVELLIKGAKFQQLGSAKFRGACVYYSSYFILVMKVAKKKVALNWSQRGKGKHNAIAMPISLT